jgi:UDP-N-acetylmuramate--alanine ligase
MIQNILFKQTQKIYFVGIGGVGMSAIAKVLKFQGHEVAGSDSSSNLRIEELKASKIKIFSSPLDRDLNDYNLLVYSSAIPYGHPEMVEAREKGLVICHRAQVLAALMNNAKTSIGVLGTHGKTTTSCMISHILSEMGQKPTCLIGGDLLNTGTNALFGNSDLWVAEVDESDRTHELYSLNYAILTNLEQDHIENYSQMSEVEESFARFLSKMKNPGLVIYNGDDEVTTRLVQACSTPHLSVGFSESCDFRAGEIKMTPFGSTFDLYEVGFPVIRVELTVPGRHNIANALSSIATLVSMGYDLEEICQAITSFKGARRRLELKANLGKLLVIDDYAHHPTEVMMSLNALKTMAPQVTLVFQPHRYTRTAFFYKEFAMALSQADRVILTEIYSAGELNPNNIDAKMIYDELIALGHPNVQMMCKADIVRSLRGQSELEGVVAFLGAGNIGEVADDCAKQFKSISAA